MHKGIFGLRNSLSSDGTLSNLNGGSTSVFFFKAEAKASSNV
jgi:hypothetical protein